MGCHDDDGQVYSRPLVSVGTEATVKILWEDKSPNFVYFGTTARKTIMSKMGIRRKDAWTTLLIARQSGYVEFRNYPFDTALTELGRKLLDQAPVGTHA